jgi:hypothetical protein
MTDVALVLGQVMDQVDEDDDRLGIVGRGRKADRIIAALAERGIRLVSRVRGPAMSIDKALAPTEGRTEMSEPLHCTDCAGGLYCPGIEPPANTLDLDSPETVERLRRQLTDSAAGLHNFARWAERPEHTTAAWRDCPAEACIDARAALREGPKGGPG